MKKKIGRKEESSQDYCFCCKDGGLLRVCDYKKCLKPYHHVCVEKDESFLNDDTTWTCGLHSCYACGKSSVYQCICCPTAYCRACFRSSNFAIVRKKTRGICLDCAKMIKMIEEDVHVNSDGEEVDFDNRDTHEFLFKDYWRLIKEEENLTLMDIQTVTAIIQRCKKRPNDSNYNGTVSEESMTELDSEDESEGEKSRKRSRGKLYDNKAQTKTPNKERAFIGWASAELIKFLTFVGKNTTEPLSQQEVTDTIKDYVQANNLFQTEKKRRNYIVPDDKLRTLFRKKKLKYHKIYDLVKKHLANAQSDDDLILISEDDDVSVPVKKQRNVQLENNISESKLNNCSKNSIKQSKSCYAALAVENIKLVYLKRSLIVELSKSESFETKVVGCFVRIKNDPKEFMYSVHKRFQIGQILGVKESEVPYTIGERSTKVVLRVSNIAKDIKLSMLSEDEIEEEECADLRQLVKSGLFKQPTIAEIEGKIKVIHKDITNHWIDREIVKLQKLIERSNEKGWRKELDEYIDRRELLCKPEERMRRQKEIPNVIPDEERVDEPLYLNGLDKENKINIEISAETENFTPTRISDSQYISRNSEKNEKAAIWHYTDPSGIDQGPFTLSDLKHWKNGGYFSDDFKVWKSGQCKEDGVLLNDALASASL